MFVNSNGDTGEAKRQAQANADRTGEPWVVFFDTSGNLRAERLRLGPAEYLHRLDPRPVETHDDGDEIDQSQLPCPFCNRPFSRCDCDLDDTTGVE